MSRFGAPGIAYTRIDEATFRRDVRRWLEEFMAVTRITPPVFPAPESRYSRENEAQFRRMLEGFLIESQRVISDLTVDDEGGAVVGGLQRLQSGLLARHHSDDGNFPFDTDDWELPASGLSVALDGGVLVFSSGAFNGGAKYIPTGVRGRVFIQTVRACAQAFNFRWMGEAVHGNSLVGEDFVTYRNSVLRSQELDQLFEFESLGAAKQVTARSLGTFYRFSTRADGTAVAGYDFLEDVLLEGTASRSAGWVGASFASGGASTPSYRYRDWIVCSDWRVRVVDLPAGAEVEVRSGGGALLASASESGGEAFVDMMKVVLPGPLLIVVRDSESQVIGSGGFLDGVWPGDVYRFVG